MTSKAGLAPIFGCLLFLQHIQRVSAADEPAWQAMLGNLSKTERAGFGGLCGVCVDHATGDVIINISDRGFYRSTDGAKSFQRISSSQPYGRTEEPGCLLMDPTGKTKRLLSALVYGSPLSTSADGGITWKMMEGKSAHIDWGAVNWTNSNPKFVMVLKHEAEGLLLVSRNGGASFSEVGKDFGTGWVFDDKTAVAAQSRSRNRLKPGLLRTVDSGRTWQPAGQYSPVGMNSAQAMPHFQGDSLYWLVNGALIATNNKAATWNKVSDIKDGRYGPVFGKNAHHLFVLTGSGIIETTDGGSTWSRAYAPPKDLKGVGGLTWVDYDPSRDTLYIMKMGSDLFSLRRAK